MLGGIFGKRKTESAPVSIPAALQPEDPVNYNSVLDYLVGLSDKDYKKMTGSVDIYREANKKVAKLIGVKDEPTTSISNDVPPVSDDELDAMLAANKDDLTQAFIDDEPPARAKKKQSTERKIEVKE